MLVNTSMQKTFLVKSRNFKEISDGKGSLEFLLVDENGDERMVVATAQVGRFGALKAIKPVYKREIPLIKALAKASVDDSISIDFTDFNAKHVRQTKKPNSKTKQVATESYGSVEELQDLMTDKSRLMKLIIIGAIGFIGFLLLKGAS